METPETSHKQPSLDWRTEARLLPGYLLVMNVASLALALSARRKPYFALDLRISQALQSFRHAWFDGLMRFVCGLGYPFQANILGLALILTIYRLGLKWEAVSTMFATLGSALLALAWVLGVNRPRPTADLVRISHKLPTTSFPSGHVLIFTAVGGFLAYLVWKSKLPGIFRTPLLALLGGIITTMGPARVYSGEHWASDVLAGYLLGSSWFVASVKFYEWGRENPRNPLGRLIGRS